MNMFSKSKKFIGPSFFLYLGAFYCGINLYLNDKLRAEMERIISSGNKKEEMQKIHERNASSYEKKTEKFEIRNQFNRYRRVLISYAKGKTLELGVGTGRSFEFYKDDADLIGIDYSANMLEQAKGKLDEKEHNNISEKCEIKLRQLDCEDIKENFPADYFDTVVDFNNFSYYYDYKKVYDNVKHVLKHDGVFLFLAKGESNFLLLKDFYKVFRPYCFMKHAMDPTINWSELIENDKDWEILYKERKNYGKTYIYVLKLKKKKDLHMTSLSLPEEDENLEILEFHIELLKEIVENYKKNECLPNQKVNKFIAEYIDLEDKILNLVKQMNISITDEKNTKKMDELTEQFTTYWSKFQDDWEDSIWEIYNKYRTLLENDKNEMDNHNFFGTNRSEVTLDDKLANKMDKEEIKVDIALEKDLNNLNNIENDAKLNLKNMKEYENLMKIGEDIENIAEIEIKKYKEEKKRQCLESKCTIY